jgi:beta-glucosidase
MKAILPLLILLASLFSFARLHGDDALYLDKTAPLEDRVTNLLGQLTLDEKLSLLSGQDRCVMPPIPRLHLPPMRMADAAAGVRGIDDSNNGPATQFTCGVMMASTWDPELLTHVAAAIGEEARNKKAGTQILLGPAVNIQRSPLGGRNGEYYSEDPFLAARLAVGYIQGMQGEGTAACIKHFACNNEEVDRSKVNVLVGERALREIYLPAFEAGVEEGHVWCVMSSYNLVNGFHSSANHYLLTDVLKQGWGFDGMVMSDWGGVHAVAPTLNAGNDVEMPGPPRQLKPEAVKAALQSGQLTQATIDDAVRRTLRTMVRTGLLDGPWHTDPSVVNSPAHQKIARQIAEQGIVLLKNQDNILPLDGTKIHTIALLGAAATDMQYGSRGSPDVVPFYTISPVAGITSRAGSGIRIVSVAPGRDEQRHAIPTSAFTPASGSAPYGLTAEYFSNSNLEGTPAGTRLEPGINAEWKDKTSMKIHGINQHHFSVRWTGTLTAPETGRYEISFGADDGCRLFIDNKPVIDHWVSDPEMQIAEVDLVAGHPYPFRAEYFQSGGKSFAHLDWQLPRINHVAAEVAAAKGADVAIVFVSTAKTEGEGHDRPSMTLPDEQDALVQQVIAANPHTIVVLNNGTPVTMPWVDQVPGLLETWFPGEEAGHAIASILFGDVNPSGKLPTTLGAHREDYPDYGNFPGRNGVVNYREGIYVGYRHFDKENIAPLFPFGYGLSYTTFDYGPIQLSSPTLAPDGKLSVSLPIRNTGAREGREVVELYLHDPAPKIDKPVRELKGFAKIDLAPGEMKTVTLQLTPRDFAYFDVPGKQWKADAGDYEIQVGASSRDLRQKATVHLSATFTQSVPLSSDQLTLNGGFGKNTAVDQNAPTSF